MRARVVTVIASLVIVLVLVCLCRLIAGSTIGWPGTDILELRAARLTSGVAIGAALAVSGVLLQALLRNPLASPFILGLASGAGFGVVLAVYVGFRLGMDSIRYAPNWGPALVGAMASLGLVFAFGRRRGQLDPIGLILVGVVVSAIFGAGTLLVLHLLPADEMATLTRWMMGRVSEDRSWAVIGLIAGGTALGTIVATWLGPALDGAALGDDEAISIGVPLPVLRPVLLLLAGALTAGAVVLAGPIAFVGLICPHVVRLLSGPGHRSLVIGSALLGAALIVGADALVSSFRVAGGRLPIGIFTALIGGPIFIWILRSRWRAGT
ncbi:MAG: iron ABC transporter permease [Phycisphaerales bacterium]|nr:iron ABC transporter permease [Phycisphaerales bacterium]